MLLSVSNLSKAFSEKVVLKNASFHINETDKAAITGINGAGKSTLLRMIIGEISPDEGTVVFSHDATYGYLSQQHTVNGTRTLWEEVATVKQDIFDMRDQLRSMEDRMPLVSGQELSRLMEQYHTLTHRYELCNGYACESEITGVLCGLSFSEADFHKPVAQFSGGQKTRIALAKILLQKPDLILLDEPTNHLDIPSIQFLENFIRNFKGAVLLISHDRYFLDRTMTKIIEIDNHEVTVYTGNYTEYAAKRQQVRIARWNAYANQQRVIRHQEEVIEKLRSFHREKSIRRAESREKMLAKMEVLEKPVEISHQMKLNLTPHILSGNDVLSVRGLTKAYGSHSLFQDADIEIKRGEHVALIGDNGTGKTTLFKIINELVTADAGTIRLGTNVVIGYYDQEHQVLTEDNTLFEEISDAYPDLSNTEIRNILAAFLFTNDDVFKRVSELSGGEQGRLCLAKLMLSECNFLMLDEPTNHLDMDSKEILEHALNQYRGTCFYISHDRYFVNRTASRILELSDGTFREYLGNYDYYLEKKQERLNALAGNPTEGSAGAGKENSVSASEHAPMSEGARDWKASKEEQARLRKLENEVKKTEARIEELEAENKSLLAEMSRPEIATNSVELQKLAALHERNEAELNALYEKWEQLQ